MCRHHHSALLSDFPQNQINQNPDYFNSFNWSLVSRGLGIISNILAVIFAIGKGIGSNILFFSQTTEVLSSL